MGYDFRFAEDLGGIICGQLEDGRYFLGYEKWEWAVYPGHTDDHTVWFFDINPYQYAFGEDCDPVEDVVGDYCIGELKAPEKYQFWEECLAFISENFTPYRFNWVEVIEPDYVICGQLADGTYFSAGGFRDVRSEEPTITLLDTDPCAYWYGEVSDDDEDAWWDEHTIKELPHPENIEFWEYLTNYCEERGYWN